MAPLFYALTDGNFWFRVTITVTVQGYYFNEFRVTFRVTFSDFVDGFTKLEFRKDQFSYDGLKLIFDYLESFEEDGEEIEEYLDQHTSVIGRTNDSIVFENY